MSTTDTKKVQEVPAGPVLGMLLDSLQAEFERRIGEAIRHARDERGLPDSARFDLARRVWLVPPADGGPRS